MIKHNLAPNPSHLYNNIVQKDNREEQSKSRTFAVIPIEDRRLVRKHGGLGLQDYWLDCWEADPYGSRYVLMPDADLKSSTRRKYRKQLKELGLFLFEMRLDGNHYQLWVLNRHGSRVKGYWSDKQSDQRRDDQTVEGNVQIAECSVQVVEGDAVNVKRDDQNVEVTPQTQPESGFQNPSISFQNLLNNQFNSAENGVAADLKAFENKEEEKTNQEGSSLQIPASLIEEPEPRAQPNDPGVGECSAAAPVVLKAVLPPADLPTQVLVSPTPLTILKAVTSPVPLVTPLVESAPVDLTDEREALNEMRRLGIERNETVLALLKTYAANVPWSLANIRRRIANGESIKNVTGAFVANLKKDKKDREPIDNESSFGLHKEINAPTEEQLQALEDARTTGAIRDYFFSSTSNTHRVIKLDGLTQMHWWEYLGVDVAD